VNTTRKRLSPSNGLHYMEQRHGGMGKLREKALDVSQTSILDA